ncbi:MAG TPA: hypothetical protein DCF91_03665 [Porphyromonadaceae bacterium]|nr:hypothetical protein [Porphyromonadaceae bacterium]
MIKHTGIGILASLLLLSSCGGKTNTKGTQDGDAADASEIVEASNKKFDENGVEIIDLSDFKLTDAPFPMSEIVDPSDVQYIKLETTDGGLLSQCLKIKVAENNVYLADGFLTRYIYQFDRSGKFINKIGKIGQGPGEHKHISDFTVDNDSLYATMTERDQTYVYDKKGNYIRKIGKTKIDCSIEKIADKLIFIRRSMCQYNDFFSFFLLNQSGDSIYCQVPQLVSELINNDKRGFYYQSTPITQTKDHILLFEALENRLYEISENQYQLRYKLEMGKYSMPLAYVYNINRSKGESIDQYFKIQGLLETRSDILFLIGYGGDFTIDYIACYNKDNGDVKFWKMAEYQKETVNSVLYNDIDGGPSIVIRGILDDPNYAFTLIYPHMAEVYLQEWRDKTVKYPEKRAQLCKLLSEMEEDDNPILVLYKKK